MLAFVLILLIGVAALVVDLAALRQDLRAAQLASDAAPFHGGDMLGLDRGEFAEQRRHLWVVMYLHLIGELGVTTGRLEPCGIALRLVS